MKQLIVVTGGKGSGKSTTAATSAKPQDADKVFVIDTENSMSDIVEHIQFGEYVRAYERLKPDPNMLTNIAQGKLPWVTDSQKGALAEYYHWLITMLDKRLVNDRFKYLIIDTVEPLEAAFAAAVESDRKTFGWTGVRAYGRLETEGIRPLYENLIEAIYARGVETIVLTTHLHGVWQGDQPVLNKVKPGGRLALLTRLSTLMLWMVPNVGNEDGAPAALVLKARMGKLTPTTDGWVTQRILPQRIPSFSWQNVEAYKRTPANLANPQPGEVPTQAEQEMISEMLTNEQMRLMVAGAEMQAKQFQEPTLTKPTVDPATILILHNTGIVPAEIARQLNMPLPIILQAIRSAKSEDE